MSNSVYSFLRSISGWADTCNLTPETFKAGPALNIRNKQRILYNLGILIPYHFHGRFNDGSGINAV